MGESTTRPHPDDDDDVDVDDGAGGDGRRRYRSWVHGYHSPPPTLDSAWRPTDRCRSFDELGYVRLSKFVSDDEVMSMRIAMERMVEDEWTPLPRRRSSSSGEEGGGGGGGVAVFRTDEGQIDAQGRSDYFLDSANAVHYFAEVYAVDAITGLLKDEYDGVGNKLRALNKAGHGLHLRPGPFADYARSPKVSSLLRELGYVDPVVPQSMYIFKQSTSVADAAGGRGGVVGGGEVTSHQDSTFLHTEPRQTCVGLWLALDDATIENGCLWVRPGSHREGLRRRFVRNPMHFGDSLAYDDNIDVDDDRGDRSEPQMIFRAANDDADDDDGGAPWEGGLPENSLPAPECKGLYAAGFVPMPCEAGDLLAFAGTLDHLSLPNLSSTGARHTFQLHCVEGEGAGVSWSRENWLQYPPGVSFMRLLMTSGASAVPRHDRSREAPESSSKPSPSDRIPGTPTSRSAHRGSPPDRRDIVTAFRIFDPTSSGRLDVQTFTVMARSLGFRATNADIRREAESLLREEDRMRGEERGEIPDSADSDGDYGGQITIDLALATRILLQLGHARRNGEEEMRAYFGTLDGGNKGFVTLEDLRRVRDEVGVAERELMDVVGSGSSDADFIGGVV